MIFEGFKRVKGFLERKTAENVKSRKVEVGKNGITGFCSKLNYPLHSFTKSTLKEN